MHKKCSRNLYNASRKRSSSADDANSRLAKKQCCRTMRSECDPFNFSKQCLYCEKECEKDERHPNRVNYRIVQKDNDFYEKTMSICAVREDKFSKNVERRLLNVSDLIAAKARYHMSCRLDFERDTKQNRAGRPIAVVLDNAFETVCAQLEDMERLSIHDFAERMEQISGEKYENRHVKRRLIEKYGSNIMFASKEGKSDLIILDIVACTLVDEWYENRKLDGTEESKRIVKTAAKLIKDAVCKHSVNATLYPNANDIENGENFVPELLADFMNSIVNDKLKAKALAQAVHASCRPNAFTICSRYFN